MVARIVTCSLSDLHSTSRREKIASLLTIRKGFPGKLWCLGFASKKKKNQGFGQSKWGRKYRRNRIDCEIIIVETA